MSGAADSKPIDARPAAERAVVLAEDARARVESLVIDGVAVVRKTYRSPALLRWRSLFRRSRAHCEFANLSALGAAGLPCIRTVSWAEERRWGCVVSSTLVTEHLAATDDLQATIRADCAPRHRIALARNLGSLLRAMHDLGFCSTTASPRNFLVRPGGAELVLIDQPYLLHLAAGRLPRRFADVDLFDAFFSPRRLIEWSATERWRGLSAYCKGDRLIARTTWTRLSRRRRWVLRLDRDLARILGHLRRAAAEGAPTRTPTS